MPDLASISTEDTSIYPEVIETQVKTEPIAEKSPDVEEKPKPLTWHEQLFTKLAVLVCGNKMNNIPSGVPN